MARRPDDTTADIDDQLAILNVQLQDIYHSLNAQLINNYSNDRNRALLSAAQEFRARRQALLQLRPITQEFENETEDEDNADSHPSIPLQCVVCMEEFDEEDIIRLRACRHHYCKGCLKETFKRAIKDEGEYPAKCCGREIPLYPLAKQKLLTWQEQQRYKDRKIEVATSDRLYCANPDCGMFIKPATLEKFTDSEFVRCGFCRRSTCKQCKGKKHDSMLDCEEKDDLVVALEALSKQAGWKSCSRCQNMVELSEGCYHITCKCKAQWCYLCGSKWKTCACPQWDESRLLQPGQRIAD